jgi:hypothetical protein
LIAWWRTIIKYYRGHFYAKAKNLTRQLTAAYDDAFRHIDLLLMPTLPTATRIPAAGAPVEEIVGRALEILPNTAPFDTAGHPAMSIPCGLVDRLPVGLMLVGRRYEEATICRGTHAFEQAGDWQSIWLRWDASTRSPSFCSFTRREVQPGRRSSSLLPRHAMRGAAAAARRPRRVMSTSSCTMSQTSRMPRASTGWPSLPSGWACASRLDRSWS